MTGQFLRRTHCCDRPVAANRDDVWQCDCGNRWTCIEGSTHVLGSTFGAQWRLRRWPWPRAKL